MPRSLYRISRSSDGLVVDPESIDAVQQILGSGPPGRYHVDQVGRDGLSSGHTSRRWGVGIKSPDGTVAIEPDPWP
jgi:hypothetical protein